MFPIFLVASIALAVYLGLNYLVKVEVFTELEKWLLIILYLLAWMLPL